MVVVKMATVKVTLTLPKELYDVIEERRGLVARSKYISYLLEKAIESGLTERII